MPKKYRYLLLIVGFFVFAIGAPLIVLYVNGFDLNFKNREIIRTGILTLRSDPAKVNFYIDGTLTRKEEGDVKFMPAAEYEITLEKPGFYPWVKRLIIKPDQVTWVNNAPEKLYLLKKDSDTTTLFTHVQDVALIENNLYTISGATLSLSGVNKNDPSQNFSLSEPTTSIYVSPAKNFFLLTSSSSPQTQLIFDVQKKTVINIGTLFKAPVRIHFSESGEMYALEQTTLYRVNLPSLSKTSVAKNVKTFSLWAGTIYAITETSDTRSLELIHTDGSQSQILVKNVPAFTEGSLYITPLKQILAKLDTTLYRVGSEFTKITSGVQGVRFDSETKQLLTLHDGELSTFNFESNSLDFITRSSQTTKDFHEKPFYGFAFLATQTAVRAIELDRRDRQNEYELYSGSNIHKIILTDDITQLLILDGETLLKKEIR